MSRGVAGLLFAAAVATSAAAQPAPSRGRPVPRFQDFPAHGGAPARNAAVEIATGQEHRYRTRLREAAAQAPNFAGHYVLAVWGCGTDCATGAAVNTRTGRVTFLPALICCIAEAGDGDADKVTFRHDSRLLVLTGMRNEKPGDLGQHFYRIEGDRFIHLRDVPIPPRR